MRRPRNGAWRHRGSSALLNRPLLVGLGRQDGAPQSLWKIVEPLEAN
jgi:hypothetical protein